MIYSNVVDALEARALDPNHEERLFLEAIAAWKRIVVAHGWIDPRAITVIVDVDAVLATETTNSTQVVRF